MTTRPDPPETKKRRKMRRRKEVKGMRTRWGCHT